MWQVVKCNVAGSKVQRYHIYYAAGKDEKRLPTTAPEEHKKEIPETLMLLGIGYFASGYMGQVRVVKCIVTGSKV